MACISLCIEFVQNRILGKKKSVIASGLITDFLVSMLLESGHYLPRHPVAGKAYYKDKNKDEKVDKGRYGFHNSMPVEH